MGFFRKQYRAFPAIMSSDFRILKIENMSLEIVVEKMIRQAIERGEFDDLKGKGEPIDLTGYFNMREDLRLAYSLLRSNDLVPEEVELLKEIASLKSRIAASNCENEKASLMRRLNQKSLTLQLAIERHKNSR
jgi:hypothetical protein